MKKALLLILVSTVAVLFTTCSEPIDFVDSVATEVKVANDLFLVVESVAPADKDTGVNPGRDIEIQFDRPIRLDSVEATTFKIIKPDDSILSWKNPRFNTTTNTLYVEPTPYLEDTTGYSILVDGIIGTDGSVLQEDVIWSFVTGVAPVGSLTVASNNPKSITESTADGDLYYTDSTTISYTVEGNSILVTEGGEFLVSNTDLSALTDGELSALGGYKDYTTPANRTSTSYTIDSGDGDKYVYAVFRFYDSGSSEYVYSKVKNALVSLDTADPSLELGSTRYARTNLYIYPQSQNNVYSYQWSGSGLSYTASTSNYTYVSASSDNLYTIQLDVWDKAGNTVHDTATLVWDTVAPTVTSVLIDSGATYSTDTTVSAAYSFSDTTPDSSPSVSTYLVELWDSDNGYYGYEAATGWGKDRKRYL